MKHTNNLRLYRRQSYLTQPDIAFLLELNEITGLSRCEKGERPPSLELALGYHVLFGKPVHSLFTPKISALQQSVKDRIEPLLGILYTKEQTSRVRHRVEYLKLLLKRLSEV